MKAHLLTGGRLRAARVLAALLLLALSVYNAVPIVEARVAPGEVGNAPAPVAQSQPQPQPQVQAGTGASSISGSVGAPPVVMSARPDGGYVVLGGPSIAASKDDALAIDNDNDGRADPGDTLTYTV